MEELIAFLNQVATMEGWPLSSGCIDHLRKVIKEIEVKPNEYLLREGQISKNMYFIQQGLLKCYYILDGLEVMDWFFGKDEVVVSIDSFYDQAVGEDFIQAIEKTRLFYISFEELAYLYRTFVEFNVVGRVLTNKYLRVWHRQARNIRMLRAEQRYALMLETQPDLVRRLPVSDLASYLDMSRETLSRLRSKKM